MKKGKVSLLDRNILVPALADSVRKLNPAWLARNPVILITEIGAVATTLQLFFLERNQESLGFTLQISLWLWFTVLFANFAEAIAEGRGKAQAKALRDAKTRTHATRLDADGIPQTVPSEDLRKGDVVMVVAGEIIPVDGEIVEGAATVNESAITGESAPVIREAGGDSGPRHGPHPRAFPHACRKGVLGRPS
jgi:K+-transporting ATPase ATPase B chain